MTQRSETEKIIWGVIFRILAIAPILFIAAYTALPFQEWNENLGFHQSAGFWGFNLSDVILGWSLSYVFWIGLVFGTIGRKTDYIFCTLSFLFVLWVYLGTQYVIPSMYIALIAFAIIGNALGYLLKQLRIYFFKSSILGK